LVRLRRGSRALTNGGAKHPAVYRVVHRHRAPAALRRMTGFAVDDAGNGPEREPLSAHVE
jgi:hypothetical protein